MLARHLLFIATRRPHNALLAIPADSIPPHAIAQPPPYISPPKPSEDKKSQKYNENIKDCQITQKSQNEKQSDHEHQRTNTQEIYYHDARRNLDQYDVGQKFFERQRVPHCNEYHQRVCDPQSVQMHNARNQRFSETESNQQFYTLPSRRPQRELDPPRSVTPDITRGLGRGSLSAMHMLARHGQRPVRTDPRYNPNDFHRYGNQIDPNKRNFEQLEAKNRLIQCRQVPSTVDARNRFATPLNLTAFGYRFFASSPVNDPTVTKSSGADVLKHNPISPIAHGYGNGLKTSASTGRSGPTVAERLALTTGNCPSPAPSSSGRSTPVQNSSGRNTPTNLILSPTKSTMSNEELFAAIHKSKKKLNIKDDSENLSPHGSMNSLVKAPAGSRHSWSPESQKAPEITHTMQSPSATSRLDFKRLLLQQSVKTGPTRLSAAEQLKLSRQQCQQQQQSMASPQQTPLTKVLSPRSVWRFQTPRTDVLSSTIIEDTAAEEKAMKPSPENTSPLSRLNSRRQLDLCSDLPDHLRIDFKDDSSSDRSIDSQKKLDLENEEFCKRDIRPINDRVDNKKEEVSAARKNPASTIQYLQSTVRLTPKTQEAVNAFESRRLSNQLARAQFLASTPTSATNESAYFKKRFRARSESPQHIATQNVARSPSAPTLETAL